ncbi:DUF6228 family protein [Longimonas halophila]|nr:DUF6228 family protein [Longimonas halophila]
MDETVEIQSCDSPARLLLSDLSYDGSGQDSWASFVATIEDDGLHANVRVFDLGPESLVDLFEQMNEEYRGWDGAKTWKSIEGQMALSCTSDRSGHAFVEVVLRPDLRPDRWEVNSRLRIDAGQHDRIAKRLARWVNAKQSAS